MNVQNDTEPLKDETRADDCKPTALDDLREAARALHGLKLPDWMRERILAGLVKDHAPAIARDLLTGEEIKK